MTDEQRICLVLADDHRVVREGVRSLLEREGFSVVGEGADAPKPGLVKATRQTLRSSTSGCRS